MRAEDIQVRPPGLKVRGFVVEALKAPWRQLRSVSRDSSGPDLGNGDHFILAQVQHMKQANLIARDLLERKSSGYRQKNWELRMSSSSTSLSAFLTASNSCSWGRCCDAVGLEIQALGHRRSSVVKRDYGGEQAQHAMHGFSVEGPARFAIVGQGSLAAGAANRGSRPAGATRE